MFGKIVCRVLLAVICVSIILSGVMSQSRRRSYSGNPWMQMINAYQRMMFFGMDDDNWFGRDDDWYGRDDDWFGRDDGAWLGRLSGRVSNRVASPGWFGGDDGWFWDD